MIRQSACLACSGVILSGDRGRVATYCSYACKPKRVLPKINCEGCGKEYQPVRNGVRFCSLACFNGTRKRDQQFECKCCSKWFLPKTNNRTSYCSRDCAFKDMRRQEPIRKVSSLEACEFCEACGLRIEQPRSGKKYCGSDECNRERKRLATLDYYNANYAVGEVKYTCFLCETEFVRHARGTHPNSGHRTYCSKRCRKKVASRERRFNGRGGQNERRESRIRAATVERVRPHVVLKRDNWLCYICGERCDPEAKWPDPLYPTIDHVIPIAKGGEHSYANVKCACFGCNSAKSDKHPDTLMIERVGAL